MCLHIHSAYYLVPPHDKRGVPLSGPPGSRVSPPSRCGPSRQRSCPGGPSEHQTCLQTHGCSLPGRKSRARHPPENKKTQVTQIM
ncbi:hypothetical protein E2C01_005830 [Portunus trituberculatus]|uniref:Uncharacterized protein n=1 Tax=Portunus trituberculatus TaxID=210409 RepID=A0A5B7CUI1_PORTR|nr:hypothetical protein [Portunus trituberculatus]